jgi:CheY-like chemotaxis protein
VRVPQKREGSEEIGKELAENLQQFNFNNDPQLKKAQFVYESMPYGKVLVVDDMEVNLYVAKGLMTPYQLKVETALSGFEAIEKVKRNEVFDIIFMDQMMPKMDGMEAVKIIRELGYKAPVIALTANALAGQAELFLANGFDGFLSKPIDLRQMDIQLHKLIYDKQPREVIEATRRRSDEQKADRVAQMLIVKPELATIFNKDAEKVHEVMEMIYSFRFQRDEDIRLFSVNAHAMKSALAYINELELSDDAKELELAGREKNMGVLLKKTPAFLIRLKAVIEKNKEIRNKNAKKDGDPAFLREKLCVILAACSEYDSGVIREVLSELNDSGKTWGSQTDELLDKIAEHLLHSEYEDIEAAVNQALN